MKRSEGKKIQIQHGDWLMAKNLIKTCTSRYGDRRSEYTVGDVFEFVSNDSEEVLNIQILNVDVKKLKDISSEEALAIGNYSWADHVADFYGIYHKKLNREVNENTLVSLIHFKIV